MRKPSSHGISALRFLWERYGADLDFAPMPKDLWINEFFFCLLGGYGISFELNKSAYEVLKKKDFFESNLYGSTSIPLEYLLEDELSRPQFEPPRKDGTLRKYRFFRTKANTIAQAGRWLFDQCGFSIESFLSFEPYLDRDRLLQCPGIGYKTASWFLRNIGVGQNLAILDIHVAGVLTELDIISPDFSLPRDYLEIESVFLNVCNSLNAPIELMDLIIWSWDRKERVGYECRI